MPGEPEPTSSLSLVVMGVSGVGKTAVAHALVARTGRVETHGDPDAVAARALEALEVAEGPATDRS